MESKKSKWDKYPARKQAERITEGKDKPHHIGKKSNAVLQQEFYQLMINYNPNLTDHEFREYEQNVATLLGIFKHKKILTSIIGKYASYMDREFFNLCKKYF